MKIRVLHIPDPPRSLNPVCRCHPCPLAKGYCCHCPLAKGCCCHAVSACVGPPPPTPFSSFPREPEPAATPRPHFLFPFSFLYSVQKLRVPHSRVPLPRASFYRAEAIDDRPYTPPPLCDPPEHRSLSSPCRNHARA
jgi:hypothetical protein